MVLLLIGVVCAVLLYAAVLLPGWLRRTRAEQGHWGLAGLIWVSGPISALVQMTYPPDGSPSGIALLLARGTTALTWCLIVAALVDAVRHPRRDQRVLLIALVAFHLALLLSCAVGYIPAAPPEPYFLTPLLLIPFVLHGGYDWRWLLRVLRHAMRTIVVLSLALVAIAPALAFNEDGGRNLFGIPRLEGITSHPNSLAIIACFAVLLELRGGRAAWLVPEMVAVLLAQSTTAWVALSLGLLALAGRLGRGLRITSFVVVATGIFFALSDPALVSDFIPPDLFTFTGRTTIWQAALQGFRLDPVFGYGPELLDDAYRATYLGSFNAAAQAHNQFVQSLGETGLVGVTALVALLIALLVAGLRAVRTTGGLSLALIIAFYARCMSETPLRPEGATATALIPIAALGIAAAGRASGAWSATRSSASRDPLAVLVEPARPILVDAPHRRPGTTG